MSGETPRFTPAQLREMAKDEAIGASIGEGDLRIAGALEFAADVLEAQQPEKLAQRFHELYEELAPQFGYETREASRKPWRDVPEQNKRLMIAVCTLIFAGEPERAV